MKNVVAVLLVSTIACGYGIRVENHATGFEAENLNERTKTTVIAAADVWGHGVSDVTIEWVNGITSCGGTDTVDAGCTEIETHPTWHEYRVRVVPFARCPESSALAHEIGHVVIGDGAHSDPRWCDTAFWNRMAIAIEEISPTECGAEIEYALSFAAHAPYCER